MSHKKARLTGKPFEELIYGIYCELEPHAKIVKNDRIYGGLTQTFREIDISIRKDFAGHEILMIVQAKDHKKSADIKIVGEFLSVIEDVRASRGILICNAGFTQKAKVYAINKGIDLCTAHDAKQKDWKGEIKVPVLRKHRTITYNLVIPVQITSELKAKGKDSKARVVIGEKGVLLKRFDGSDTNFMDEVVKKWSDNALPTNDGKNKIIFEDIYLDLFPEEPLIPKFPLELEYEIISKSYFKLLTLDEYRGIRNFVTEKFTPSFVEIKDSDVFIKDSSWKFIEDPTQLKLDMIQLEIEVINIDNFRLRRAQWNK